MSRLSLTAILLALASGAAAQQPQPSDEEPIYDWTVTVVRARNLQNTDWGKRKLSDPLVIVREHAGAERQREAFVGVVYVQWDWIYTQVRRHLPADSTCRSRVPGVAPLQGRTEVIEDSLSPEWSYSLKTRRYSSEGLDTLVFLILDEDRGGFQNIGWAQLVRPAPGTHRLPLRRVVLHDQGAPGELVVEIERGVPEVVVPDVGGQTAEQAGLALSRVGLKFRGIPRFVPGTPRAGILRQMPAAGARLKCGSTVTGFYEQGRRFAVPPLVGLTEVEAGRRVRARGLRMKVEYRDGEPDATDGWFKVSSQSVEPGELIYRSTPVSAVILKPPPGAEIEVPDLRGKPLPWAKRILASRYLKLTSAVREETTVDKAGKVLAQEPAPGARLRFDGETGLELTYGFFADGLSYDSAKRIALGEAFEGDFSKADLGQFRRVTVPERGYLVSRKMSHWPHTIGCLHYDPAGETSGSRHRRLNCVKRVTPGEWVLRFLVEYHMTLGVVKFDTDFVPEFDPAEPNDDFESAADITVPTRLTIGLCPAGDADIYRFETKAAGYLFAETAAFGKGKDAQGRLEVDLQIFDSERKKVWGGGLKQVRRLPAGQYFLRFSGGNAGYDLRPYDIVLDLAPDTDGMEPNDSVEAATVLRVPASTEVRYATDDADYYRLVAEEPGWVVISHPRKLGPWTYVWPYGPDGKAPDRFNLPCAVAVVSECVVRLATEREMRPASSYEPVNLDLVFVPRTEDPLEPNDDPAAAPIVAVNKTHEALLLPVRDHDCYRFRIEKAGPVEASIPRGYDGTFIWAQLHDAAGEPLEERGDYVPRKWDLQPGEYVVAYHQHSGDWVSSLHSYTFRIDAPNEPAPAPDSDRYTAPDGATDEGRKGLDLARRAYAHYLRNEFEAAAPLYEEASGLLPGCAALWNDFGSCCFRLGSLEDARAHYRKAVEIDPGYALALRNLGVVARRSGDLAGYVEWTGKAVAADATAENLSYHGHALLSAGATETDPAERWTLLDRAVEAFRGSLEKEKDPAVERRLRMVEKRLERLAPK